MGRRELFRVDAKLEVEYKNFDQFFREYTKNLSRGGIFIKSGSPLKSQDVLEISLKLPGQEKPVSLVGEVVHVITPEMAKEHGWEAGMGIHFIDFEEGAHQELRAYVTKVYKEKPRARTPDRRKHDRLPIRLRVKFPSVEVLREDYSEDISHGGIFIQTPNPRDVGEKFIITLVHPDTGVELELAGEVVRVTREGPRSLNSVTGMGIRFLELDDKKQEAIANFLGTDLPKRTG